MQITIEGTRERLRPVAGLSEGAEASRIRAELRTDRGDHRRSPAARRAPRIMVGDVAQPAGKGAAARSLSRSRLYRNAAGGWEEREVQEDSREAVSACRSTVITGARSAAFRAGYRLVSNTPGESESFSRHRPYRRLNLGRNLKNKKKNRSW